MLSLSFRSDAPYKINESNFGVQIMNVAPALKRVRLKRFLPYLAIFQADLHQTLRSWLYRLWVVLSLAVGVGYVLYRFGAHDVGRLEQSSASLLTDLSRWLFLGGVTLIIILTAGTISSERDTMADAVLSRGISRIQYYMGKWHSRVFGILATYFLLSAGLICACYFLLHDYRLSLYGSGVALLNMAGLLLVVISCAVAVSAICHNTLLAIAVVWMLLSGMSIGLTFLPPTYPAPDRILRNLPNVLCGYYDIKNTWNLLEWCGGISAFMSLVGIVHFSRRDI
jgi:ABC-type transport system involved in multi-copper enzyme maturation permease subunit